MTDFARPNITPEMILAYLDGEDLPHVAALLASSPDAVALADDYRALQGELSRTLFRHDCPTTGQLGEYALNMNQFAIAAHITACPHCTAELVQIRAFLAVEADPPALRSGERIRRLLTAVLALPALDSAAFRSVAGATTQTYQVEDYTIALDPLATPRQARFDLDGSIWRERDDAHPVAGAAITLNAADGATRTTTIDEFGSFLFEDIPNGDYHLEIALDEEDIAIPHVRVE